MEDVINRSHFSQFKYSLRNVGKHIEKPSKTQKLKKQWNNTMIESNIDFDFPMREA